MDGTLVTGFDRRTAREIACPSCGAYGGSHFKGCKPFSVTWWKPPERSWVAVTFNSRLSDSVYLFDFDNLDPMPTGHPVIEFIISDIEESGLSPTFVADRAGLNQATVKQWFERRITRPHDKTISRVLDVLGWRTLPVLQPS